MRQATIYQCECEVCQAEKSPEIMQNHHLMNVLISRLDEQERRWKPPSWVTVASKS